MKPTLKHRLEYCLLRTLGAFVCLLPYRGALLLGWLVSLIGAVLLPGRLRESRRRIESVLSPYYDQRAIRRITRHAWRNICLTAIEVLRTPCTTREWINRTVSTDDIQKLQRLLEHEKNVIIAVPHMGNWELAGIALQMMGFKLLVIVRRQKNPLTDAYLERLRTSSGMTAVDREADMRRILRLISRGHLLAILPDIRARTEGLRIRFLGHEADLMPGMALFARTARVPILPACTIREGWARHRWIALRPVYPDYSLDKKTDWQRMTQEVMSQFEELIRRYPDQYFWFNKRWILDRLAPAASDEAAAESGD